MYKLNKDYFKCIDTEEKAYWLGFIFADGCITECYKKNSTSLMGYALRIKLQIKDIDVLYKFKECLKAEQPIKISKSKLNGKTFEQCYINICCTYLCKDLIKLGCCPRKSLTTTPPTYDQVPRYLVMHFIRGYFDGDGWVSYWTGNKKYKILSGEEKTYQKFCCSVGFCGTDEFLDYICNELGSYGLSKVKYRHKTAISEMQWSSKSNVIKFYHAIYDNANIYMDRKYKKFIEIMNCSTKK